MAGLTAKEIVGGREWRSLMELEAKRPKFNMNMEVLS